MWASKLLTFQITLASLLFAALTIELAVEHPEWSPNGLTELKAAPPDQMDMRIKLLASPE